MKYVSASYVQIILPDNVFGAEGYANFDIQSGEVCAAGSSVAAAATPFANGWVKCEITATASNSATGQTLGIRSIPNPNSGRATLFDGNRRQFLLWNCQVEEKAASTSPIVTAGSSGARERDCVQLTSITGFGTSYSTWARGAPRTPKGYGKLQAIIELFANGFNRSSQRRDRLTSTALTALVGGNGGNVTPRKLPTWKQGVSGNLATAFAAGDLAVAFDGQLGSATYPTLPLTPSKVIVGSGNNGTDFWWNGDIEGIAIWFDQRLPNEFLEHITKQPN